MHSNIAHRPIGVLEVEWKVTRIFIETEFRR